MRAMFATPTGIEPMVRKRNKNTSDKVQSKLTRIMEDF